MRLIAENSGRSNNCELERPKTCLAYVISVTLIKYLSFLLIIFGFFSCSHLSDTQSSNKSTGSVIVASSAEFDLEFDEPTTPGEFHNGSLYIGKIKALSKPLLCSLSFMGKKLPVLESDSGNLIFLLPIDLKLDPGSYDLQINSTLDNGSILQSNKSIKVIFWDRGKEKLVVDPSKVFYPPDIKKRIEADNERINEILSNRSFTLKLWDGRFGCPTPKCLVTSSYGLQRLYNNEKRGFHSGVDLKANLGNRVIAPATGRVVLVAEHYLLGNLIIIDHGMGVMSILGHLSKVIVKEGELVVEGMTIARSGATGRATGPHLHWSLSVSGMNINPLEFMYKSGGVH